MNSSPAFISCAHEPESRAVARALATRLRRDGVPEWLDEWEYSRMAEGSPSPNPTGRRLCLSTASKSTGCIRSSPQRWRRSRQSILFAAPIKVRRQCCLSLSSIVFTLNFGCGLFGSGIIEVIVIPRYYRKVGFWVARTAIALAAGILAVLYDPENPLLAVHIGHPLPLSSPPWQEQPPRNNPCPNSWVTF